MTQTVTKIHPIYDVRHAPPDVDKAVQTIKLEHDYAKVYEVPETEEEEDEKCQSPGPTSPRTIAETPSAEVAGPSGLAPHASSGRIRHVFMPVGYVEVTDDEDDHEWEDEQEARPSTSKKNKKKKDKKKKCSKVQCHTIE